MKDLKRYVVCLLAIIVSSISLATEKCTVTFDLNYQGAAAPKVMEVAPGRAIPLDAKPLPQREGYRFAGWYTSKETKPEQEWLFGAKKGGYYPPVMVDSMAVDKPMRLYARWVAPTHITTAEQLSRMRDDLYGWYVLDCDIDLEGYADWEPIGGYEHDYEMADGEWWKGAFKGELDGQGHTIKNLQLTTDKHSMKALFAAVANGEICNLTLENCRINLTSAPLYVAPLVGVIKQDAERTMLINHCDVRNLQMNVCLNTTESVWASVTGLIAGAWNGMIEHCHVDGHINVAVKGQGQGGDFYVGGILGEGYSETVDCYAALDICTDMAVAAGANVFIGGLQASATRVIDSKASGSITVDGNRLVNNYYIGGLVGSERYGRIENCQSSGRISMRRSPKAQIGGVIGEFNKMFGAIGTTAGVTKTYLKNCQSSNELVTEDVDSLTWDGVSGSGVPEPIKGWFGAGMSYDIENCEYHNPPSDSKPRVWWHWMNGNIIKEGIRKDLLWMKRAGIGGFQVFDAGMQIPQVVEKRLAYMTPEWRDAFAYAISLADSLGLEVGISSSPGWSLMGGPWVQPEDGMKKLTWREILVTGNGKEQVIALPKPFTTSGPYQNKPIEANLLLGEVIPEDLPCMYRDVRVLAVPVSDHELSLSEMKAEITSDGNSLDRAALTDGDLSTAVAVPIRQETGKAIIDIRLPKAVTIRSLQLSNGRVRPEFDALRPDYPSRLWVENADGSWKEVAKIPSGGAAVQTMDIPETTGSRFRLEIDKPGIDPTLAMMGYPVQEPKEIKIVELNIFTTSRVNHSEEKTGFMATFDLEDFPTPTTSETFPKVEEIIDLTDKLQTDGSINCKLPKGRWRIIRFGWSLTGKRNHPASPEATGLEIDKLDKEVWQRYYTTYLNMYKEAANGLIGQRGIQYLLTDSYESGASTWTANMAEEFKLRRGYDLMPWMPALTGYIINSAEETERFLWDWRKTISELIAENYDQLTTIVTEQYGMKGRYTESHEHGRLYMVDGMDVKRKSAVPMAAIWAKNAQLQPGYDDVMAAADIRESASVAHIYGQNIVAAESFTVVGYPNNAWTFSPESLKPYADLAFANGLNRVVVHTSPHQPVDTLKPGLSLTAVGQWFDRHETWAEQANVWTDYLSRTCEWLQKGRFVADIAYYYGEDNNISALFGHQPPAIPQGYDFDYVSADALLHQLKAENGEMVTPSGMHYRVLVLDKNVYRMSLAVLKKIAELADAGIVICGAKPEKPASLMDDKAEFERLIQNVWSKKNVITDISIEDVLSKCKVTPDLIFKTADHRKLRYLHRITENSDIYWVSNPDNSSVEATVSLRQTGRRPMLYSAETGKTIAAEYRMESDRTHVILNLQPKESIFILLTEQTDVKESISPKPTESTLVENFPAWTITFQEHRGAPLSVQTSELKSLTDFEDVGIRYFSGTATYQNVFKLNKKQLKNAGNIILDLGDVKNIAEVYVNGKQVAILWKQPFKADITEAVKAGENLIEVKVTNLWANRLIGDTQPDTKEKVTYTSLPFYQPNAPLLPSGLIGPVRIIIKK
jgi:hypothetical protein